MRNLLSIAPLLSLLLSGCWPYLSDPYEDYVDGDSDSDNADDLYLIGDITWSERIGDYWNGAAPGDLEDGIALVGFTPGARTALARWSGGPDNCQTFTEAISWVDALTDVGGPDTVTLRGTTVYRLEWQGDNEVWGAGLPDGESFGHRVDIDMDGFSTDMGDLNDITLVRTPRRLDITTPDMSGSEPPTVSRTSMRIQWTRQDDAVLVRVITANDNGDPLEDVVCGVNGDATAIAITSDDVPSMGQAAFAQILVGNVTNGTGDAMDGVPNSVSSIYWQNGAVFF